MGHIFKQYAKLDRSTLALISAEFFIQLINASFIQILLIYMAKAGYDDAAGADFISYRFLGVLLISIPMGLFIRGRRIKPLFWISSVATPVLSILIVCSVEYHRDVLVNLFQFLWGLSLSCILVSAIPYILRNCKQNIRMEAITLSSSTWSLGGIVGGLLIYILSGIAPDFFGEKNCLIVISSLGFLSIPCLLMVTKDRVEPRSSINSDRYSLSDIQRVLMAALPSLFLAVGAGLTIPFVGLFFYHIHGFDSHEFALLSAVTTVIVFFSFLMVPNIKQKFGINRSIMVSQGIAIFLLVNLALTQLYHGMVLSVLVASFCYMFRQPLMNLVSPMAIDVSMEYVGEKNRELMSALQAAIWSGSWFLSSKIFLNLRKASLDYVWVFLITALIYTLSVVIFYHILLKPRLKNQ